MKNEQLVKADEFGLEVEKAVKIQDSFAPKIIEGEAYANQYAEIVQKELTPKLVSEASSLRKKLVKVRTGIAEVHRAEKAFYLSAGRYVDALKNKLTVPIEHMESKLREIETHYERIEAEKLAAIKAERIAQLQVYGVDTTHVSPEKMTDDVWNNYLSGTKLAYEQRKEAERKAEEERLAKEKAEEEERERIRLENERLKKEAEEKEAQLKAEREAAEKALQREREKAEKERREAEDKARIEREKLQAELAAKEAKEKAEREAAEAREKERFLAEKKAKSAPDKEKLIAFQRLIAEIAVPEMATHEGLLAVEKITASIESLQKLIMKEVEAL